MHIQEFTVCTQEMWEPRNHSRVHLPLILSDNKLQAIAAVSGIMTLTVTLNLYVPFESGYSMTKIREIPSKWHWDVFTGCLVHNEILYSGTWQRHFRYVIEHYGVSNRRELECLFKMFSRLLSNKTSNFRWAPCEGNSQWTVESPHKGPAMQKWFPYGIILK